MNSKEPRAVWLRSKDGVPHSLKWALVKTAAEIDSGVDEKAHSWFYALGPDQPEADGWDATPTTWRRCPVGMDERTLQDADVSLRVEGRKIISGGLSYDLDAGGRVHPQHKEGDSREPLTPDAVIEDEDAFLAMSEVLGQDVSVFEKGTLKRLSACGKGAAGDLDAKTDEELLAASGADVVICRKADASKRKVVRA